MNTISLCMIVKNEEQTIGTCLDTVKHIVDEIVIVDTGSTDGTKEIVSRYTHRIYDFEWIDDFAAARNYSFSLAAKEYIFWLDADDQLCEPDRQKLLELKQTLDPGIDSVSMVYHVALDQSGDPLASCRRNRLVKRINQYKWHGAVHEYLHLGPEAKVFNSDISVFHTKEAKRTQRNINIYQKMIENGKKLAPRDLFHYGDELFGNEAFEQAVQQYVQFLNGKSAGTDDVVAVCMKLSQCYQKLGDFDNEMYYLLRSLEIDAPGAEQCCRIGNHFFEKENWHAAVFWFNLAAHMVLPESSWQLINRNFYTWVPHQHLAICYGKLGMLEQAYHHNEIARSYLPDDRALLNNKQILEQHLPLNGKGEQK